MASTAFEAAKQKLESGDPPFALIDLPPVTSHFWNDIKDNYHLSLPETTALQNFVQHQQQQQDGELSRCGCSLVFVLYSALFTTLKCGNAADHVNTVCTAVPEL